jgi:hypothetical protein
MTLIVILNPLQVHLLSNDHIGDSTAINHRLNLAPRALSNRQDKS